MQPLPPWHFPTLHPLHHLHCLREWHLHTCHWFHSLIPMPWCKQTFVPSPSSYLQAWLCLFEWLPALQSMRHRPLCNSAAGDVVLGVSRRSDDPICWLNKPITMWMYTPPLCS